MIGGWRFDAKILSGKIMKVLVVGSGGREHALCWSIAASPLCDKPIAHRAMLIAAEAECVPIGAEDVPALVDFAKSEAIDFVGSARKRRFAPVLSTA